MFGLGDESVALIVGRFRQPRGIDFAVDGLENFRSRVELAQFRREPLDGAARDVGLGHHQPIGQDHLLARFRRPAERIEAVLGVDQRQHHFDMEHLAERAVGGKGLQDRAGIGKARGLDDDAAEVGDLAAVAFHQHAAQRLLQIAARDAAQAAIAEQHGLVGAGADQRVVDAGSAEFVDDDGGAGAFRRAEKVFE